MGSNAPGKLGATAPITDDTIVAIASPPGQGGVDWDTSFAALKESGYDGWMVVEAFGLALPDLAAATKIWRKMYDSEDQLCRDALSFMKSRVEG